MKTLILLSIFMASLSLYSEDTNEQALNPKASVERAVWRSEECDSLGPSSADPRVRKCKEDAERSLFLTTSPSKRMK